MNTSNNKIILDQLLALILKENSKRQENNINFLSQDQSNEETIKIFNMVDLKSDEEEYLLSIFNLDQVHLIKDSLNGF